MLSLHARSPSPQFLLKSFKGLAKYKKRETKKNVCIPTNTNYYSTKALERLVLTKFKIVSEKL